MHKGTEMINSISLEKERYEKLLPVVAGSKSKVVALCMSEEGMPETVDQRVAIAEKLVNGLVKNGVPIENIYVDPLVQPAAANHAFGMEFLQAIERTTQTFKGVHRDFAIAGYFRYSWSIITENWSFIHWLKEDEKTIADSRFGIYGKYLGESTAHLLQMKKANAVEDRDMAFYNRAYEEHKKATTLDGEDQWTCTAASSGEVPENDELYDRKTDPFQLENIASERPGVARELFEKLRLFMSELRAC
jgi:hypothetical protein